MLMPMVGKLLGVPQRQETIDAANVRICKI